MSFIKVSILLVVIGLIGCSSNPNYYKPSCGSADLICLALAVAKTVVDNESSQKCSDMTDEKRKACEAQVESLNKHISDANKYNKPLKQDK